MADNVIEIRPGIMRDPDEVDESNVLDNTGAMVGLALLAQDFERQASAQQIEWEDARLAVAAISPMCTLLQRNPQFCVDLQWEINKVIANNVTELTYDDGD